MGIAALASSGCDEEIVKVNYQKEKHIEAINKLKQINVSVNDALAIIENQDYQHRSYVPILGISKSREKFLGEEMENIKERIDNYFAKEKEYLNVRRQLYNIYEPADTIINLLKKYEKRELNKDEIGTIDSEISACLQNMHEDTKKFTKYN